MFSRILRGAPILLWFTLALLAAELAAVLIGPAVLPSTLYLRSFLGDQAIAAGRLFINGQAILLPDSVTGWRNRPDTAIRFWVTDSLGSRSARPATWARTRPIRVLALGSSTTNGGLDIDNSLTLPAFLETDSIEALNFATMLYGADQVYLQWSSRLRPFGADVILLGLDVTPEEELVNVYVPLHDPEEVNMPLVKPRYRLGNDSLELVGADPQALLRNVPDNPQLVEFFERNDEWAWVFNSYRRFGMTPVAAGLRAAWRRVRKNQLVFIPERSRLDLTAAVLQRFKRDAEAAGSQIVFLYYPNALTFRRWSWRSPYPDAYAERQRQLAANGVEVVDVRAILRASGTPASQLFHDDGIHFTALGNRVIADGIRSIVRNAAARGARRPQRATAAPGSHD